MIRPCRARRHPAPRFAPYRRRAANELAERLGDALHALNFDGYARRLPAARSGEALAIEPSGFHRGAAGDSLVNSIR